MCISPREQAYSECVPISVMLLPVRGAEQDRLRSGKSPTINGTPLPSPPTHPREYDGCMRQVPLCT